jgi:PAS domain S-box-containing protein
MVVEDEVVVQLHLTRIVEELGYELVGAAADREDALEQGRESCPELVLMDIHLADGTDGIDTARQLVEELECAVIFISAYADESTVERAQKVGAAGYLVKPFTATQVRAAIATAFASHAKLVKERVQNRSLSSALEQVGGAMFMLDQQDRVSYANQTAADLVGWPVYKVYGRNFFEVVAANGDTPELREALRVSRTGASTRCSGLRLRDSEGRERAVDVAIQPVESDRGGEFSVMLSLTLCSAVASVSRNAMDEHSWSRRGGSGERLLVYSHDTFGLGHLRRCMAIIRELCRRHPESSILLVTGSPMVHRYPMPPGADYVKLPALQKVGVSSYEARTLQIPGADVKSLRSNLILHAAQDYAPTALLVDHSPTGGSGELLPTLEWLGERGDCVRILGLRDIIDDPVQIQRRWAEEGIHDVLEEHYDHIAVYGNQSIFDTVSAYGLSPSAAAKTEFVDYICSGSSDEPSTQDASESARPLVFVTIGGGDGGGESVLVPFLQMMREHESEIDFEAEVLTGPFVEAALMQQLTQLAEGLPVRIRDFLPSTRSLQERAAVVVSTAGYNTVTDVLSWARSSVLIPRVLYRKEQLIRARRLAELGLCTCVEPDGLTPQALLQAISSARSSSALQQARAAGLPLQGVHRVAELFERVISTPIQTHR